MERSPTVEPAIHVTLGSGLVSLASSNDTEAAFSEHIEKRRSGGG